MIKKEFIGCQVWSKLLNLTIIIQDDPSQFALYKSAGLDVFEDESPTHFDGLKQYKVKKKRKKKK